MTELLDKISQISIYLKEEDERINEIALFAPLGRNTEFDESSKPIHQRKWSYTYKLPLLRRLSLMVQSFLFKKAPLLIPAERITREAKFKTVLALLLAQESLREFFFSNEKRRRNFFQAVNEAASAMGYEDFSIPSDEETPLKLSQKLTLISGKQVSLIDDLTELNLQMATLTLHERNEILFRILNRVERPPITSILEVMHGDQTEEISLTTHYAKYKIIEIGQSDGKIAYRFAHNQATSSIKTLTNSLPGMKGVMNQRSAIDSKTGEWVGSYSGELSVENHILEQLLFILNFKGEEVYLLNEGRPTETKTILLTSLFSWHEIGLITDQHTTVRNLNKKMLKVGDRIIELNLLHFNISFNAFNKYPTPSEMGATMRDINDQALISIMGDFWQKLGLNSEKLSCLKQTLGEIAFEKDFLKHQERLLKTIDAFRELKNELLLQLRAAKTTPPIRAAMALLTNKKPLRGMDLLLNLNVVAKYLGYLHNKNCQNSTDRSAGANAADKAQYAYEKIYQRIFLPCCSDEQETALFKVLYSMYLVWEEPEINAALSTGFVGEKFYHNFFQKNPETTRYLIQWLKKHPEIYLGLSSQRS